MILRYSQLKQADEKPVSRGKPSEMIHFNPPLVGPNGAKITGYEWKWFYTEVEDDLEGTIQKRVSDWDNSSPNDETGREIVHQFYIEMPDKTSKRVSAESVPVLLGLVTPEQKQTLKGVGNSAKTLARLKVEKIKMEAAKTRYNQEWAEVMKLPLPTEIDARYDPELNYTELSLGDAMIREYGRLDRRLTETPEKNTFGLVLRFS